MTIELWSGVLRKQPKKSTTNHNSATISSGAKHNLYINHPKMVRIWLMTESFLVFAHISSWGKKQRKQICSSKVYRMPNFYFSYPHLFHDNNLQLPCPLSSLCKVLVIVAGSCYSSLWIKRLCSFQGSSFRFPESCIMFQPAVVHMKAPFDLPVTAHWVFIYMISQHQFRTLCAKFFIFS